MEPCVDLAQIAVISGEILTPIVGTGVTVIVIGFDITGVVGAHAALLIIATVYTSPFTAPVVVYVAFVSPEISTPPFFH